MNVVWPIVPIYMESGTYSTIISVSTSSHNSWTDSASQAEPLMEPQIKMRTPHKYKQKVSSVCNGQKIISWEKISNKYKKISYNIFDIAFSAELCNPFPHVHK
jgi:hypothetical protein